MSLHVVFDIETLGTRASSKVLTIGATFFDDEERPNPSLILSRREIIQLDAELQPERTVDIHTLRWWIDQSPECVAEGWNGSMSPAEAERRLNEWAAYHSLEEAQWWCRGPHFDASILENLFNIVPWRYNKVRDSRTLFAVSGESERDRLSDAWGSYPELVQHAAEDDAAIEAICVQDLLADMKSHAKVRESILGY